MFKRLSNLIKGFFGLFISGMEKNNPEALLEVEKENLRTQIAKYNQGLASHAALCERLMSQIKKLDAEGKDLRAKTTANLKAGNKEIAAQYALRLQTVSRELEEDQKQLEQAETTYKELLKARDIAVQGARTKIDALKRGIDDMKVQKAMAELNEMAAGMVSNIGGSGDTLDRLHEMVEEERNKAAGKARVAKDSLNTVEFQMKEAENTALAEQALADFAAAEGIQLEEKITESAEPLIEDSSQKSMGPIEDNKE
ncbi:MAG: PspA/IM30 family protein [Armatimonadota bacterium]